MSSEKLAVLVALFAALLAAAISVFVGVSTVASNERAANQTAFIGAIQSVGGTSAGERTGGAVLARSIVTQQLDSAADPPLLYSITGQARAMRNQATANYRSAIRGIEVTLRLGPASSDVAPASSTAVAPIDCAGPPPPREVTYQANEFVSLLKSAPIYDDVAAQAVLSEKPAVDLSRVNLCGQRLSGLDLTRVLAAYLRATNLRYVDLQDAHLDQAAILSSDLTGARLSGATAIGTDFTCSRGLDTLDFTDVDVSDAVFTGTTVTSEQLRTARGRPARLPGPADPPCR